MQVYMLIQIILLVLLGAATLYIFVFSVAGLFYRDPVLPAAARQNRIAVLIPGYKEDEVIVEVARHALQQQYPVGLFDVVIIADSFRQDTLNTLRSLPVKLIEVSFDKSTKSKALNKAMAQLTNPYDIAVVLDADNIMAPDFLQQVNTAYAAGYKAIQGHRTAKNLNTSWAVLDAVSEEINNHIFRKGHRVLGLSSAIIGSGMAFDYSYFKAIMADVKAVGCFDKEIELRMLKERNTIIYLSQATIYDEKVQKADVFGNQRRRWLSAQLHYFKKDILPATGHLFSKGNLDYFDKAIQFIQPPRILLLGAVGLFTMINIILNSLFDVPAVYNYMWIGLATACVLSFVFSIPRELYSARTGKAVLSLPRGMFVMLMSLLRIKGANKTFIHTKHTAGTK